MRNSDGKIVLYVVLFLLSFWGAVVIANAQSEANDEENVNRYPIRLVRQLLEQPKGFSVSWLEKRQNRLGDAAAIALVKLLSDQRVLESRVLQRSLEIVRGAFAAPCLIEVPADRKPSITLLFLRDLARRVEDENDKKKILDTVTFVEQSSFAPCSEDKTEK